MKTCLARERGTGGRSEHKNEHHWTFVNKEKHIKNVFESNRSQLLSEVVEKPCFSTKNVSKRRAVHPTLPPGVLTRDSPRSQPSACSKTCDIIPHRPPTAMLSIPPRFRKGSSCRHLEGTELRQNDEAYFSGMGKSVNIGQCTQHCPQLYS